MCVLITGDTIGEEKSGGEMIVEKKELSLCEKISM
jgi:hypothetical protein